MGLIVFVGQLRNGDARQTDAKARLVGPEQVVFDWTRDACSPDDITDAPARAFRDASGTVHLFSSSFVTRAMVGPSLDRVVHSCQVVLGSNLNADPAAHDDHEWILAPYTSDGRNVFALVHNEYQGYTHEGRCFSEAHLKCWYNSVTLATSRDGGYSFSHRPAPKHLVAAIPYRYQPGVGPYGIFQPSNIVRRGQFYYSLVRSEKFHSQPRGVCVIRTRNLADPTSWRAWNGRHFSVRFVNPYKASADSASKHVCQPVSQPYIHGMTDSLTYNTYLKRFLLVSIFSRPEPGRGIVRGIFFSVSKDLIRWTRPKLIKKGQFPWTYRCAGPEPILQASVLDPKSRSRNFETTGRRAYLYFVRFHYHACRQTEDRDLVRVPIEFSK